MDTILATVEDTNEFLAQTTDVEKLLGYTFSRKLLLVEALTHASYHLDTQTISYERMEFLGDSGRSIFYSQHIVLRAVSSARYDHH